MRSSSFLMAMALFCGAVGASAQTPLPSFATEQSTAGWMSIPEPLARTLVASGDKTDRELVDEAIKGDGLARNYRQFFRARKTALAVSGPPALFVRPASDPHYTPFYGAHIFRFWFISSTGNVLLASAADKVSVLDSVHAGMHDLAVSQCHGGACYDTTEVFEHGKYRDATCSTRSLDTGQTSAGCP